MKILLENCDPELCGRTQNIVVNEIFSMASGSSRGSLPIENIKHLTPTTRPCPLEVIVTRTWNVKVSNSDTSDFNIMDTDGDQIVIQNFVAERKILWLVRYSAWLLEVAGVLCLLERLNT